MTREEKQLLLIDLCARLLYGVKLHIEYYDLQDDGQLKERDIELTHGNISYCFGRSHWSDFKPYLRPMSSMTEEELDELLDGENSDFDGKSGLVKKAMLAWAKGDKLLSNALFSMQYAKTVDWLNEHHFDYRGLIEKGLAIEAPEGMYKTK